HLGGQLQHSMGKKGRTLEISGGCEVDSLSNSVIERRNKLIVERLAQEEDTTGKVTPTHIWDFITKLGFRGRFGVPFAGFDGLVLDSFYSMYSVFWWSPM
ncbi:hypothetical protein Ancab_038980, partial [Ancistrocladus abbreviatus]